MKRKRYKIGYRQQDFLGIKRILRKNWIAWYTKKNKKIKKTLMITQISLKLDIDWSDHRPAAQAIRLAPELLAYMRGFKKVPKSLA